MGFQVLPQVPQMGHTELLVRIIIFPPDGKNQISRYRIFHGLNILLLLLNPLLRTCPIDCSFRVLLDLFHVSLVLLFVEVFVFDLLFINIVLSGVGGVLYVDLLLVLGGLDVVDLDLHLFMRL